MCYTMIMCLDGYHTSSTRYPRDAAGPYSSFVSTRACNLDVPGLHPGRAEYICHRGCAYTVLQTVQRDGMYCAAYGNVHYKEPLNQLIRHKKWG